MYINGSWLPCLASGIQSWSSISVMLQTSMCWIDKPRIRIATLTRTLSVTTKRRQMVIVFFYRIGQNRTCECFGAGIGAKQWYQSNCMNWRTSNRSNQNKWWILQSIGGGVWIILMRGLKTKMFTSFNELISDIETGFVQCARVRPSKMKC